MKVLVCDPISDEGLKLLYETPGIEITTKYKSTEEELLEIVPEYHAILVRSQTKITAPIIEKAVNLKVIGRAGVGVDNIDVDAATLKGVVVVNAPEGNTIAATEHTMAMMLALARNIPQANFKLRNGQWDRKSFMGVELRNKVLGVVGLGKIGSQVAKRAKAFEMKVVGYDPYISKEKAKSLGVELLDLDELLKVSDFITLHLPKTEETKNLINEEKIALMKDGVRIINCARGGIIDEEALKKALETGKVAGAALDVFSKEPYEGPLVNMPQVVATPHLGASTEEAQIVVAEEVAEETLRVLKGEPVRNAVNIPFIKSELYSIFEPYLGLAETLGKFISQLMDKPVEHVKINYNGDIANYDLTTLTNTILKGLLRPILQDSVNYVNAPIVAKNRGIKVEETKSQQLKNYANLINLEVKGNGTTHQIAGTIFSNGEAKLVQLDGFSMDAAPTKHMLIVPHVDKPGMIGKVGTILGEEQVNVAGMQVGRKEIGGNAVMIMAIDHAVSEQALEKMRKIDGIFDVRYVCL
ncbi:MAG: phosphoglycerate dehydrogenase [Clostridia bacterium]|nr:phosphoglycerate dehydrogenase [Clostridia bacterium]